MKNQITVGGKVGYLNPKTGRYKYVEIVGTDGKTLQMKEMKRQNYFGGKYSIFLNEYTEKVGDILKYLKTPSPDWKDGRPLIKYRGTVKNY